MKLTLDSPDLTRDAFLGGQLSILQPRKGYRAGVDPVLLAASVPAGPGDSVLELGCGVGVASLCLSVRVGGLKITGLELQPVYAELARQNAAENKAPFHVVTGDISQMPAEVKALRFDHVIANPPYYRRGGTAMSQDAGRETAMAEQVPLENWVQAAARRTAPKGFATFIQRADRLPDLTAAMQTHFGSLVLQLFHPRKESPASLAILRGRKAGRAGFIARAPIIMHQGTAHTADGEDYAPLIGKILREGASLPMAD